MAGALEGVKVLEIAQVMAIPVCGVLLSDMGANVVKVEPPTGDASRHTMQPVLPGESKSFAVLNRGKRSVVLDLTDARSRPALEALARWADVVLVSVKHEDLATYRIGYEHLRPLNPEMVYLEHTPLGHDGPMGDLGSYDLNVTGICGLTALIGKETRGHPQYTQPALTDMGTGYLSAMAVCAALYARKTTGRGQRIETSLLATGMITACNTAHEFAAFGLEEREQFLSGLAELREQGAPYGEMQKLRDNTVQRARRGNIYYRYYRTRDSFISVGCLSPALQAKFREATGIDDPRLEADFDPGSEDGRKRLAQLTIDTEALMQTRANAEWSELFARYKIPCGPVSFPEEAINDPQVVENGYVIELDHELLGPYKTFAPPVRMDRTPTRAQGPSPLLGAHTKEALREAGMSEAEVQDVVAGEGRKRMTMVRRTRPLESDEEISDRVKTDFMQRAVYSIEQWVDELRVDGLGVRHSTVSRHHIQVDDDPLLFYEYWSEHLSMRLYREETEQYRDWLRPRLAKPESLKKTNENFWIFQVSTDSDLDAVKQMVLRRLHERGRSPQIQ